MRESEGAWPVILQLSGRYGSHEAAQPYRKWQAQGKGKDKQGQWLGEGGWKRAGWRESEGRSEWSSGFVCQVVFWGGGGSQISAFAQEIKSPNGIWCLSDAVRVTERKDRDTPQEAAGKKEEARLLVRFRPSLNCKCFALHHAGFAKSNTHTHTYTHAHPTPTLTRSVCRERWKRGASGGFSSILGPCSRIAGCLAAALVHALQSPSHGWILGRTLLCSLTHGCVPGPSSSSASPSPACDEVNCGASGVQ